MNSLTNAKAIRRHLEEQIERYEADLTQLKKEIERLQTQLTKTLGALESCRHIREEIKA